MIIKTIPSWFPWQRAITIWWPLTGEPWVYVPAGRRPSGLDITLCHEVMHIPQWKAGRIKFLLKYITPRGRLVLEVPGVVETYKAQHRYGEHVSLDTHAHIMKKVYRLWGISVQEISEELYKYYNDHF